MWEASSIAIRKKNDDMHIWIMLPQFKINYDAFALIKEAGLVEIIRSGRILTIACYYNEIFTACDLTTNAIWMRIIIQSDPWF